MSDKTAEHIMLDLETLGTAPGAVVLSIGAVCFTYDGLSDSTFYRVINLNSAKSVGLKVDPDTETWWRKQSIQAQEVLSKAEHTQESKHITLVLSDFSAWVGTSGARVWSNGSDFDQPLLAACYAAIGRKVPWKYYHSRCYRTLKALVDLPLVRIGLHHDALDDARTQAAHAVKILQRLHKPETVVNLRAEEATTEEHI
jgi:hypothetical protein